MYHKKANTNADMICKLILKLPMINVNIQSIK